MSYYKKKDAWSILKFQYRYVEQDFRDIDRYLNCLDDMADFLDEEDELGGLPDGVLEAQEKLYEYFVVLYRLRKNNIKSEFDVRKEKRKWECMM